MKEYSNKKGISLIVLVITIIIIIILASSVILSMANNNPIEAANEAKFKNDIQTFNTELSMWLSKEYVSTLGKLSTITVNATKTTGDYNNLTIQQIIPSMSDIYASQFAIRRAKLVYVGTDSNYNEWARELGFTNTLNSVDDYVIYYDVADSALKDQIRAKDLAVLEPQYYIKSDIDYIKSSGTITLGYIPISEVNVSDTEFINLLQYDDFLYDGGTRKTIAGGGIYLTNLASQHYCDVVMQMIKTRVIDKGFDGIFIDCIDSAESLSTPAEYDLYKVGYENILKQIRQKYGSAIIMQNRGFNTVTAVSNKYIDAILWESFGTYEGSASGWYLARIADMADLQNKGIKVFAVSNSETGIAAGDLTKVAAYAQKLKYVYYHTAYNHYNAWPF